MACFAPTGKAKPTRFTGAERWKVVVKHVTPLVRWQQSVNQLLIGLGAKRYGSKRLCFTSGEECGTVWTWQDAQLAGDGPNVRCSTSIQAFLVRKDHLAHLARFDVFHDATHQLVYVDGCVCLFVLSYNGSNSFGGQLLDLLAECTALFFR